MNGPRVVVIVDGYTDEGRLLASRFLAQGISCIAVLETPKQQQADPRSQPAPGSQGETVYRDTIECSGNLQKVVQELEGYTVLGVIPGSATGIALADALSERMDLCTNGTRRTGARQDKFLMQQTLIDAGIPTKEFIRTSDELDLLAWYRSRRFGDIVLKPVNRASGRGILVCRSEQEVRDAFRTLMDTPNENGGRNLQVLAEEYLAGTEYCVDTVSRDGKHRLAGITECRDAAPAGTREEKSRRPDLPYDDHTEVVRYTISTLDALRIRYGAASTRIMMTQKGPLLIDTAAWMSRGTLPRGPSSGDLSHRKADLMVEAYCNPEGFARSSGSRAPGFRDPANEPRTD